MSKLLSFFISILISFSTSAESEFPYILDTKSKLRISFSEIGEKFSNSDVLLIGEEHDDKVGHIEKAKLIKFLAGKFKFSLSLEMIERDQQTILDEFLSNFIEEKTFIREIRGWSALHSAYGSIVQFAKENQIRVLASNTPRRYANLVSRKGLEELWSLPEQSKKYLPPLFSVKEYLTPDYETKLFKNLELHGHNSDKLNLFHAQGLWDASMADSIIKECKSEKIRVIHINGRFHSDDGLGITYRLRKMGLKVTTISMFKKGKNFTLEKDYSTLADVIYLTEEL